MIKPEWGVWFILVALLPLLLKIFLGEASSRRIIALDWLVLVFLITAWVGYWAAYDKAIAWSKVWFIMTGVLLYCSLSMQPRENLVWVSVFLFCIGVGVSLYYFLTHDFVAIPRKIEFVNSIGRSIMNVRPQTGWTPIHPNYVAGMIAVTTPFILYPVMKFKKNNKSGDSLFYVLIILGLVLAVIALLMATSRGVIFAIVAGVGTWFLWRFVNSDGIKRQFKSEAVFPVALLIYLIVIVVFLYVGPARSAETVSSNYYFGSDSRAELFGRSLYLFSSFLITGGGLGSFPGLYSRYLLDIPFFNVPNSHNLFLDVGIEQGVFGGISFILLYLVSLWTVSVSLVRGKRSVTFHWIVLFSLTVAIVHGMVDDYLYNGVGSMFALLLVGLSMNEERNSLPAEKKLDIRTFVTIIAIWLFVALFNFNQIRATWYANLGAVQLAKVELAGFPNAGWIGDKISSQLDVADASLHSALRFDSTNRTANQHLGVILMLRQDFQPATTLLEKARMQAPKHRGILKSLGYCYVWLGDMEKAQKYLSQISEAKDELDAYTQWWKAQGRDDLSENAFTALSLLKTATSQP
ncbi:MAG: O-antigen ligase family protein [Anaerolineales bacterium]|nr:O-antigen ligase family protein [Anaerolineales bacterium]